jgi:hypothetical protein
VHGAWVCGDCHWERDEYVGTDLEEIDRKEYDTLATSHCERNSYRYWKPSTNHCPPEHNDIRPYTQSNQAWLDRLGVESLTDANIHCMFEDHKVIEDINKGAIWFEGYVVTMYKNGTELDEASCWGFLGVDDADREEATNDAIEDLLYRAAESVQKAIEKRENEIEALRMEDTHVKPESNL